MRTEMKELHQRLKTTTVYVTHDQIEAMTLGDKIVVMHDGVIEQVGAPLDLYDKPVNQFVAGFIGSPAMNFLNGKLKANGSAFVETAQGHKLPLKSMPQGESGRDVVYGIRPEHFELGEGGLPAEVVVVEPTGSETQVVARIGNQEVIAVFRERQNLKPGDKISLRPRADTAHLFAKDSGKRI
jgi:multiple sugar transport system ATP-binding protein